MRADAVRNREVVLQSAAAVLVADPDASMQTIAQVSGLGRTTLYRHFSNRGALLDALVDLAVIEFRAALETVVDRAWAESWPTSEVLMRLARAFLDVGLRWRALRLQPRRDDPFRVPVPDEPLLEWLTRLREQGQISDLSPEWCYLMIYAMAGAAYDEVECGRSSLAGAAESLGTSFTRLLLGSD